MNTQPATDPYRNLELVVDPTYNQRRIIEGVLAWVDVAAHTAQGARPRKPAVVQCWLAIIVVHNGRPIDAQPLQIIECPSKAQVTPAKRGRVES
jgi:hypothetical protein